MKIRKGVLLNVITIVAMIAMSSCAAMSQKHKASTADSYYEDLSPVRQSFPKQNQTTTGIQQTPIKAGDPVFLNDVSKQLNSKLDTIAENNKKNPTAQGYRILVYAGTSSEESKKIRQLVYSYNSDLNVYTQFKQPSFRVKVGDFQDRVEASYILNDLKENFPNAMIVPDQINLVR